MSDRAKEEAAWGFRTGREPRWPATVAIVAALILYIALPDRLIYGSRWILPILEAALVLPLQFATPHRHIEESQWRRLLSILLIALVNIANLASLALLVAHLVGGSTNNGRQLIFSAILIWLTNVIVFGLWFWELDRGGPGARCSPVHRHPDFLFPQMSTPAAAEPHWTPSFLDYMYVSFTNATAFSPTDTLPLSEWAKGLMMVQAMASFLTVGIVAARAVNILK